MNDGKIKADLTAIGEKIRSRRVRLGLSQEQLAELCGITPSYVGHIERASRQLSLNTAISISTVLQISLDYLLLDVKSENGDVGVLGQNFSGEYRQNVKKSSYGDYTIGGLFCLMLSA